MQQRRRRGAAAALSGGAPPEQQREPPPVPAGPPPSGGKAAGATHRIEGVARRRSTRGGRRGRKFLGGDLASSPTRAATESRSLRRPGTCTQLAPRWAHCPEARARAALGPALLLGVVQAPKGTTTTDLSQLSSVSLPPLLPHCHSRLIEPIGLLAPEAARPGVQLEKTSQAFQVRVATLPLFCSSMLWGPVRDTRAWNAGYKCPCALQVHCYPLPTDLSFSGSRAHIRRCP